MKQKHGRKPESQTRIARERIKILFTQAKEIFHSSSKLANRYITLARKIAMKYKVKLTSSQKRSFCKHCYIYLVPGNNSTVRIHKSRIIYYCKSCKKYTRINIK